MGDDGAPHGVEMLSEAAWVKFGSAERPVPPMTAIRTVPVIEGIGYGHHSGALFVFTVVGSWRRLHSQQVWSVKKIR